MHPARILTIFGLLSTSVLSAPVETEVDTQPAYLAPGTKQPGWADFPGHHKETTATSSPEPSTTATPADADIPAVNPWNRRPWCRFMPADPMCSEDAHATAVADIEPHQIWPEWCKYHPTYPICFPHPKDFEDPHANAIAEIEPHHLRALCERDPSDPVCALHLKRMDHFTIPSATSTQGSQHHPRQLIIPGITDWRNPTPTTFQTSTKTSAEAQVTTVVACPPLLMPCITETITMPSATSTQESKLNPRQLIVPGMIPWNESLPTTPTISNKPSITAQMTTDTITVPSMTTMAPAMNDSQLCRHGITGYCGGTSTPPATVSFGDR